MKTRPVISYQTTTHQPSRATSDGHTQHSMQEVILSVLKGHLRNPNKTNKIIKATIILDTFSDKSYITTNISKQLGLEPLGSESVTLSTLEHRVEKTYDKAMVQLLAKRNVTLTCYITDNIISLTVDKWKQATNLFPKITFKGLNSSGTVHVDMLVGMDYINLIRGTEIIRVGELEARSSILGYYLEGRHTTHR